MGEKNPYMQYKFISKRRRIIIKIIKTEQRILEALNISPKI